MFPVFGKKRRVHNATAEDRAAASALHATPVRNPRSSSCPNDRYRGPGNVFGAPVAGIGPRPRTFGPTA